MHQQHRAIALKAAAYQRKKAKNESGKMKNRNAAPCAASEKKMAKMRQHGEAYVAMAEKAS